MAKVFGISAGIGLLISLILLVALAWYAAVLRGALSDCQGRQAKITNGRIQCESQLEALRVQIHDSQEAARQQVEDLEARLEAAGALRQCVSVTANTAG